MSNDEGAFMIKGWKLKDSNWIYSKKKLVHGVTNDDFESKSVQLAISRKDAQWMKANLNDDEEEDDE